MKEVIVLGSTGSIGTQSLNIIRENPDRLRCTALCCGHNAELLREQIEEFKPEAVSILDDEEAKKIKEDYPDLDVYSGEKGAEDIAQHRGDIVISALVGVAGLIPTLKAMDAGKDIALANKETMVTGGPLAINKAKEKGVKILPVDSEHSAIFQCLQGQGPNEIEKIYLTASGGPFRGYSLEELGKVSLKDALKHPNWSMGQKVTIDSSTMMNKGLEVIEASYLFDIEAERIEVLVHPQSIVHSMISYEDGAVIAQLGLPDMGLPIAYALTYPDRVDSDLPKMDMFKDGANLSFEDVDKNVFRCLGLAYEAIASGHSYQVVLNAANEVVVSEFARGRLDFLGIQETIEEVMSKHQGVDITSPRDVLEIDRETRKLTMEVLKDR